MPLSSISAAVHHEAAPWIERAARVGFVAKALLYMTIGFLAASAALGLGGRGATDQRGAMQALLGTPLGRGLLATVAIGLVGYAIWRIVEGISDPEQHGHTAKGIAMRVQAVITGLVHLALAFTAAKLVLGHRDDHGGGKQAQHWTGRALAEPGGRIVVMLVAAAIVGYGLYQLYCAVTAKLAKQLSLDASSAQARRMMIGVSRFGIAARGVVFGMTGVLLFRAAREHDANEAGGVAKSLGELFELGTGPFVAIAVGLIAYGGYQLINARYRRIRG
jgi:hypothetical protein